MTEQCPITREQIALALCCPDKEIRCKSDTCGCQVEYRDQLDSIAELFGIVDGEQSVGSEK